MSPHSPLRMTGCWVLLQLENTEEDLPLSDLTSEMLGEMRCFNSGLSELSGYLDTVKEAEQSGGRESL